MRDLLLTGLLVLGVPRPALAQLSEDWYVNPYLGGITPDKPWHASGSGGIYGLDIGMVAAWRRRHDQAVGERRWLAQTGAAPGYQGALDAWVGPCAGQPG